MAQQAATWLSPERESQLFDQQMQLTHLQQNPAFGVDPVLNQQGEKINQAMELMRQQPAPMDDLIARAALILDLRKSFPQMTLNELGNLTDDQLTALSALKPAGATKPATGQPYGFGAASPPEPATEVPYWNPDLPLIYQTTGDPELDQQMIEKGAHPRGRAPGPLDMPDYGQVDAAYLAATDNRDPHGVRVLDKDQGHIARQIAEGAWRTPDQSMELVQLQAQAANLQNQIAKGFDPNDPQGPADWQQLKDTLQATYEQIGVLQDGNRQANGLLPGVIAIGGDISELMDGPRAWQAQELGNFAIQVAQGDPYESAIDLLNSTVGIAASGIDWALHLGDKDWADTYAGWVKDPANAQTILDVANNGFGTLNLDTDGDGLIDSTTKAFYGGRAVWEYYVSLQGKGSRAVYDIAIDPTVYGTLATGALYNIGRRTAAAGLEGLATESGFLPTLANIGRVTGGGAMMAPEALINKTIDVPLGWAGSAIKAGINAIPGLNRLPELSDQAAADLAGEEATDILNRGRAVGSQMQFEGGEPGLGSPPSPPEGVAPNAPTMPPGTGPALTNSDALPAPSAPSGSAFRDAAPPQLPNGATQLTPSSYAQVTGPGRVTVTNTDIPSGRPNRTITIETKPSGAVVVHTSDGPQIAGSVDEGIQIAIRIQGDAARLMPASPQPIIVRPDEGDLDIPSGVAPPEPQIAREAEQGAESLGDQFAPASEPPEQQAVPTPGRDLPAGENAVPLDAADAPTQEIRDSIPLGGATQYYDPSRETFAADIASGSATPSTGRASGTRVVDQAIQVAQSMPTDGQGRLTYFNQVVDDIQRQMAQFVTALDEQISKDFPVVGDRFRTGFDGFKTTKEGQPLFQEVGTGRVVANQPPAMAVIPQEIQSVTNVVDEYIPTFNDAFGQMPAIESGNLITASRWEKIDNPGTKVSWRDENPRWLVQRAAFGTDKESADAINALRRLGDGIPNLPDQIDQLAAVHRRYRNLVENGPPPPWSAPSPPIGNNVLSFRAPSLTDILRDASDYAAASTNPRFANAMPPDLVAALRTGTLSQREADFLSQVVTLDENVGKFAKGTKVNLYDLVKEYESAGILDAEDANYVITTLMRDQDLLPTGGLRVRENPKAKPSSRWEVRNPDDKVVKSFSSQQAAAQYAERDGANAVAHYAGEAYSGAQQMFRENVMFNVVSGPAASNRDMISNAFWMAGNGDLTGAAHAMVDYTGQFLNALTPSRTINLEGTLERGAAPFERVGAQMPSTWKEAVDNFGLFGTDDPIIQKLVPTKAGKTAAGVFSSKTVKNLRQSADVIARTFFGSDAFVKHLGQERIDWLLYTRSRLEGLGLPPERVDELMGRLGDLGDTYQGVRLFNNDEILQALDGEIPNGLAEHLSRRWRQSIGDATGMAKKDVDKALYSYKYTKGDELVSKLLIFHYWMSRSLVNNARVFKDNPWMIRTAYEIQQYMNETSDMEGLPPWSRGVLKFWGGGGSYLWFADPISLVLPWASAREVAMSDGGVESLKDFDNLMQLVGVSPLIQAGLSAMGWSDPYRAVDITGTTSPRGAFIAGADFIRNWVLPEYAGDTSHMGLSVASDPVALVERAITNGISSWMSDHGVPLSEPTDLPPVEASQVRRVNENIFDAVIADAGLTWEQFAELPEDQQRELINQAAQSMETVGTDHPDPFAVAAMQAETITQGIKRVVNSTSPIQVQTSYGPQINRTELADQYADNGWTGTAQQTAASSVEGVVKSANPTQQSIFDGSYEVGTPRQREINEVYNQLANADFDELIDAYGENASIEIGGTTYWLAQLQYMDQDERYALADQWAAENGYTSDLESYKNERDAYREANPEMAAFKTWQSRQYKYPGGALVARDAMMSSNPNYAKYVNNLKPADRDNPSKLFNADAYLAWSGYASSIYDPNQKPNTGQQGTIDYLAGLIEGQQGGNGNSSSPSGSSGSKDEPKTERTPNASTQTAKATTPEDVQDVQSLQLDEQQYNSDRDQYNASVESLFGAPYSELSKDDQRLAREEFGAYPRATGNLKKYYNWRDQQLELDPDADVSFDAYILAGAPTKEAKTDSKTQEKIGKAVRSLQIDEQEYYEDTQRWDAAQLAISGGVPWEQIDKSDDLYGATLDQIGKRPKATGELKKYWDWRDQMQAIDPNADVSMEAYYASQYDGANTFAGASDSGKPDTGHTSQQTTKGLFAGR